MNCKTIAINTNRYLHMTAAFGLLILSVVGYQAAYADTTVEKNPQSAEAKAQFIHDAQEKLQQTFSQLKILGFSESPIAGIYEIMMPGKIMYYYPDKELLIFGEIYTKEGKSLTKEKIASLQAGKIKELPLEEAIVIGSGDKTIIEFTDPDCPYCKKFNSYIEGKDNVKRLVFFTPLDQLHPESHLKAIHVLCSEDKAKALNDIFTSKVPRGELLSCEAGKKKLARHKEISGQFGVQATPTLAWEGSVHTGFQQAQLAQYVNQP